ncbi:hypothetical protein CY34DRAFT_131576 [Suillus luteus UH-Slu-Lm8-n1]|uniref:Unplaced genomic scaffold CY34scaffold_101, whole genome shotgun sequence n=1 Tax=Suillus luteus UH-Slu-Lm8-n1 TaxID=930992 RepID=A0A0D0B8D9_9AGAM|nr:hypothetical protein CY34DRAFT_131576 [Suillus luteus UH-Slu-Lm8-n1]
MRVSTKSGISISDPRHSSIPYLFRHHAILLIHRMLPFSARLEALCPSRGISIIEQPSFIFNLPSIKYIFPSSIPRIIIAALRNMILFMIS